MTNKSAQTIRDFICEGIASGALRGGQRLPTERALAERFAVSRAAVRRALTILEGEARITRHIGRGTFIADQLDPSCPPAQTVNGETGTAVIRNDTSPSKILEARAVLEVQIIELAVVNATEADLETIRDVCESLENASSPAEFERLDADFHRCIAAATHNVLIVGAYDLVNAARRSPEWRKLKERSGLSNPGRRARVQDEHRAIVQALAERHSLEARQAVRTHLAQVRENLLGY